MRILLSFLLFLAINTVACAGMNSETYRMKQGICNAGGNTHTGSSRMLLASIGEPIVFETRGNVYAVKSGLFNEFLMNAIPVQPTSVPVGKRMLKAIPSKINPEANQTMTIAWYQDSTGPVTIKIYNLTGNLVRTLADRQTFSGGQMQHLSWSGDNQGHSIVASGIYIVHLSENGKDEKIKVCVLK